MWILIIGMAMAITGYSTKAECERDASQVMMLDAKCVPVVFVIEKGKR